MYDTNGLRYTNEYMAQEYRNEAANSNLKLKKLVEENKLLKLKIAELEKQILESKSLNG